MKPRRPPPAAPAPLPTTPTRPKSSPATSPSPPIASKGERTEQQILASALRLFATRGFAATTMRDIAEAADRSPGLTYRYFGSKEQLVAALYRQLADQFADGVATLPPGTLADRFHAALALHRALIAPHRATLTAVMGQAFDPASEIGVLGAGTAGIRTRTMAALREVVEGATDAPAPHLREPLVRGLHAVQLLLVLLQFQDRSPGQKQAAAAADLARDLMRMAVPMLALPMVAAALVKADTVLRPLLDDEAQPKPKRSGGTKARRRA